VIVVACPERAERILQAGNMGCPRCSGRLRPFGHGRTRTVRGRGGDMLRVTPRRARCGGCGGTQILLPTTLTVRRADSTEVIGAALAAKAGGAGFRAIAATLGRPVSTVRSWLRRVSEGHARWLYERAVDRAVQIDRELLVGLAQYPTVLGQALNLLAGAALRYRERLGLTDPVWALIGFFAQGRLLAPRATPLTC
jgi:Homeodomain-like domain-containing protein